MLNGFLYPVSELAEVGVDAWHVGLATLDLSKRHKALKGPAADQGAPRVTLLLGREGESNMERWRQVEVRKEPNDIKGLR